MSFKTVSIYRDYRRVLFVIIRTPVANTALKNTASSTSTLWAGSASKEVEAVSSGMGSVGFGVWDFWLFI